MKHKFVCLILASLLSTVSPALCGSTGQSQDKSTAKDDKLKLSTELVSLKVTVSDPFGRVVTGLRKEQFQVYDEKIKQEIAHFTDADAPISIGIIYDVSGSMKNTIGMSFQALKRFVETSHEDDDFFLITFNDRARLVNDFTTSGDKVLGRLTLIKPKGSTALYDAVYLGIEKVQQGRHKKKALLIISDGEDNNSRYSHSELRERAKEADVQLYGISLLGPEGFGGGVLSAITELSGGRTFSPGDQGQNLLEICTRIALELRHQYSIGYYPTNAASPVKRHRVDVKIDAPKGLGRLKLTYKDWYEPFNK